MKKLAGGDVKYGAGNPSSPYPYSAQSFDWYKARIATLRDDVAPMDPALKALVKTTTAGRRWQFQI